MINDVKAEDRQTLSCSVLRTRCSSVMETLRSGGCPRLLSCCSDNTTMAKSNVDRLTWTTGYSPSVICGTQGRHLGQEPGAEIRVVPLTGCHQALSRPPSYTGHPPPVVPGTVDCSFTPISNQGNAPQTDTLRPQ